MRRDTIMEGFFFFIRLIIQYTEDKLKQNKKHLLKQDSSQALTMNAAQTKIY